MPRYFFNALDGMSALDTVGVELANLKSAKREAVSLAGRLFLDDPEQFWRTEAWQIEVSDASGLILFELHVVAILSPAVVHG